MSPNDPNNRRSTDAVYNAIPLDCEVLIFAIIYYYYYYAFGHYAYHCDWAPHIEAQ
jgi:hypothetical protein